MRNEIIKGDALEVLKSLPSDSVHVSVTSPPYWSLRDYGISGQIGLEATPADYIENMAKVFREALRVLRCDGVCFVNVGDSYAAGGHGGHQASDTFHEGWWKILGNEFNSIGPPEPRTRYIRLQATPRSHQQIAFWIRAFSA